MPRGVGRSLLWRVGLVTVALLATAPGRAVSYSVEEAPRVASINLCSDQLLLKLAEPEQIATVTRLSRDPAASFMADKARRFPANGGHAEEVLIRATDLVLAGQYTQRETLARLRALNDRVVELPVPRGLAAVRRQIRRVARLVGHPARGERLVAHLERMLGAVRRRLPEEPRRSALVLRPNGVSVGKGSLLDSLMRAAGLRNVAPSIGIGVYGEVPLERVVHLAPDLLILGGFASDQPSLAQGVLAHPVFDAMDFDRPPLRLPRRLWACGGWFVGRAVAQMAEHAYGIEVPEAREEALHAGG